MYSEKLPGSIGLPAGKVLGTLMQMGRGLTIMPVWMPKRLNRWRWS